MNEVTTSLFLVIAGSLAGFIDAIAGGGGLITLPTLSLILGAGLPAIGTNKIGGATAAAMALFIYIRRGHMDLGRSFVFAIWVALGSLAGSRIAPLVPKAWFSGFLIISCPLILWVVYRKDLWVAREAKTHVSQRAVWKALTEPSVVFSGILCGFYDGIWGPGGGTFMFLALVFVARLPLLTALTAAKLANTGSALTALVSYSVGGWVHWREGITIASAMAVGAWFGAHQASRRAAEVVRPVLVIVVSLLVVSLLLTYRR
jgi:uncharacterized membrane protein YfcA